MERSRYVPMQPAEHEHEHGKELTNTMGIPRLTASAPYSIWRTAGGKQRAAEGQRVGSYTHTVLGTSFQRIFGS